MEKSVKFLSLLLISFLILGIFAQGFVLADNDNSGSGNSEDDDSNSRDDEDEEDDSKDEDDSSDDANEDDENSEDDDSDDLKEVFRSETRTKDGETKTKIFNRTINEDGTITITKVEIEEKDGEIKSKIKTVTINADGEKEFEIETEFEIDEDRNKSRLRVRTREHGNLSIILPEEALERVRERLEARNITNITLREKNETRLGDNNRTLPRVVYIIETNENGKFLGIFKMRLKANAEVDAETGEVKTRFPWWVIFVSREESIRDSNEENETNTNSTNNEDEDDNESESNDSLGLTIPDEDGNSSPVLNENGEEMLV